MSIIIIQLSDDTNLINVFKTKLTVLENYFKTIFQSHSAKGESESLSDTSISNSCFRSITECTEGSTKSSIIKMSKMN